MKALSLLLLIPGLATLFVIDSRNVERVKVAKKAIVQLYAKGEVN